MKQTSSKPEATCFSFASEGEGQPRPICLLNDTAKGPRKPMSDTDTRMVTTDDGFLHGGSASAAFSWLHAHGFLAHRGNGDSYDYWLAAPAMSRG